CQFGSSCFYAHVYRDGTKEKRHIRTIQNGEQVKILDNVRLWDFMEDFDNKRGAAIAANGGVNNDTENFINSPMIISNLSVYSPAFIPSGEGLSGNS
ncbi:3894_t:CDS:1, partial [Acaulospora morrowiae]